MLIQIHILQNYAPANLNRDDTGAPKDAIFGGVRRGRISSQCLKRSIRRSAVFAEAFQAEGLLGIRTKALPDLIKRELEQLGVEETAVRAIIARVPEIGRESQRRASEEEEGSGEEASTETEAAETKQLIFIGHGELRPMAEKLAALYREQGTKKWTSLKIPDITKTLGGALPRSVDIAMFGRMTTSDAFENVQAAVQVAHALSANALTEEVDYYTAVDDLSGESGAGMIGDVEFNSSTYYKYFNVHWEQLVTNLGGDRTVAQRAVLALVEAACTTQPSGKQNSFAAHSLPDLVLVEVRERNLPVSYANAFAKPVRAVAGASLIEAAVQQLAGYVGRVSKVYDLDGRRALIALENCEVPGAAVQPSLPDLLGWLKGQLPG
jgi:CRISPR system Cascade subunit CasC